MMTAKINYGRPKSNVKYWARKTWDTLLINILNGTLLIIAFYWYEFYDVCYFCAAFFGLYIVAKGFLIIKFTEISYKIKIRQPIKVNYIKFCLPGVLFDQIFFKFFLSWRIWNTRLLKIFLKISHILYFYKKNPCTSIKY